MDKEQVSGYYLTIMSAVLKLTRPKMSEAAVQSAVLSLLRYHPKVAWAHRTNTGAMAIEDKGKRRFVRFGVPGWPDLTGMLKDGRFLAIEIKAPGKKPTPEQAAFLDNVNKHGGLGFWVSDPDAVMARLS